MSRLSGFSQSLESAGAFENTLGGVGWVAKSAVVLSIRMELLGGRW